MNSDVLVKVDSVSKKFCRDLKTSLKYGIYDIAAELNPLKKDRPHAHDLRAGEFWAVKDVSFELKRGQCLGLIGRNGAGKTTLLKMLNGLIKPDTGRIEMNGRVGSLIALGAGFNPILTGRENIYVNGSILGLTKQELDHKIEEIIDFSEVREFIDAPVQSYSSGMQVRLGFAIATAIQPDVLILDEVLAVGDASFRHKCFHRITQLMKSCAVIFVSHSMDQVASVSTFVGMMRKGSFQKLDNVADGIRAYDADNESATPEDVDGGKVLAFYPPLTSVELGLLNERIDYGGWLELRVKLHASEPIRGINTGITVVNHMEQAVMTWNLARTGKTWDIPRGESILQLKLGPLLLHGGTYTWNFGIQSEGALNHLVWAMRAGTLKVKPPFSQVNSIPHLPQEESFSITAVESQPLHSS